MIRDRFGVVPRMSIELRPYSLSRPLLEREMEMEVNEVKAAEVGAEEVRILVSCLFTFINCLFTCLNKASDEDEEIDEDWRRNRRESKKGKENLINRAELLRRVSFNMLIPWFG